MATTNQRNRPGGQKGQNQGGQGKLQQAGAQVSRKMSDVRDEMADYVSQGSERFGQMTQGHEGQAVLVALAAGFGIGFVIGCALVSGNRRPQTWRERMMAEGIGRKFMNQLEHMLPQAVTEHLGR
jgi:hypothetical protein